MNDRRQPSSAALVAAAVVVVLSLGALVLLPLIVMQRTEHYRTVNEQHAEPTRAELNEINNRLSLQIAALTRAAVTRDEQHLARYRRELAPMAAAMRSLASHAGVMGRRSTRRSASCSGGSTRGRRRCSRASTCSGWRSTRTIRP